MASTSEYAAFTLVFIAAAAAMWSIMFTVNWWFAVRKTRQADRMRAVDGILNSVGPRYDHLTGKASAGSHWTVGARYDYTVASQRFAGERFALEFNSCYPDERAAFSVASRFRPGERVTVWYDPDSPATAVLDKNSTFAPNLLPELRARCGWRRHGRYGGSGGRHHEHVVRQRDDASP